MGDIVPPRSDTIMNDNTTPSGERAALVGLVAALASFVIWGLLPVYWEALKTVATQEVVAHRIVWTFVVTGMILTVGGRWGEFARELAPPSRRASTVARSVLLSGNWLLFIWGVSNGRLLEVSLGYFCSPLVSVLLARIFLGEKLRWAQLAAIALAVVGVVVRLTNGIGIPWLALLLAVTFPSYALLRKISRAESVPGLAGEAALASVPSVVYLVWLEFSSGGTFVHAGGLTTALLAGGGVMTALPLLLFGYAARRISLTTLGFTQYLCPSIMFFLAYDESVNDSLPTFVFIWIGLAVFTWDGIVARRRGRGELAEADRPARPATATSK